MKEVVVAAVRYSFELRREVVFQLTYSVTDGPRPETERWFLIRKEECRDVPENLHDGNRRI